MPPAICVPPMPSKVLIAVVGLGCVAIGVALALWGRKAGRPLLALVFAVSAAAAVPLFVEYLPVKNVWAVGVAAAVTASLLAIILARLFWAVMLGAALGIVALALVAHADAGVIEGRPAWDQTEFETFGAWCFVAADHLLKWLQALWGHAPVTVVLAAMAPVLLCVVVELILPRSILILATGAFGGSGAVAGAGLLVLAFRADWAQAWIDRIHIPGAVAAAVAVVGAAWQVRAELRERAAEQAEEEGEPAPGGAKPVKTGEP